MCLKDKLMKVFAEAFDNSLICTIQLPFMAYY